MRHVRRNYLSFISRRFSFIPISIPASSRTRFLPPEPEGPSGRSFPELPPGPVAEPGPGLIPGCYQISFEPESTHSTYRGTMRVEVPGIPGIDPEHFSNPYVHRDPIHAFETVISGDLYLFPRAAPAPFPVPGAVPVYPRQNYYSYLKVIALRSRALGVYTLEIEEYYYTHPGPGEFDGLFSPVPGRIFSVVLEFNGSFFEGRAYGPGETGIFRMGWVTPFFRQAILEVDTVEGAIPPGVGETEVPSRPPLGSRLPPGLEDFETIFATGGWRLDVVYDSTALPVPEGVNPNSCGGEGWTNGALHGLMHRVRREDIDLDREWRLHLLVVPGGMGCGRGRMYDIIEAPREGVVSFSNDGYPRSGSVHFGSAEGRMQREVPRAFLRSAAHELGHGFNQIHQEMEGGADNSIMTTTPSVANVLGGPPGVFPDDIELEFNHTVRGHLIHLPDPVVRPGGLPFGNRFDPGDQELHFFKPEELELKLSLKVKRLKLGEPAQLQWQLINNTGISIPVPNDISVSALHTHIHVIKPDGLPEVIRPFVINCEGTSMQNLQPGHKLESETTLFWSSRGFAFQMPGKHVVEVRIIWNEAGMLNGVKAIAEIWVDYPDNNIDNEIASLIMHNEVGIYVALGGHAPHLKEAVSRIQQIISKHSKHPVSKALAGFFKPLKK